VAEAGLRDRSRHDAARRRYIASLLWPERLPLPANDNGRSFRLSRRHGLLPLAASLALLAVGIWAALR
jgi:hypothetical protein